METSRLLFGLVFWAGVPHAADFELFEKQVRPLLVKNCYSCHSVNAKPVFAALRLDTRAGLLKIIEPGHPARSRLIQAVRGRLPAKMPPTGPLKPEEIAALENWIQHGAASPEETAARSADAFDLDKRRREHWAWQPVRKPPIPEVRDAGWPLQPIDRFLLAKLEQKQMRPAAPASTETIIRRLYYDLTGLPPLEPHTGSYEALVDGLLASPRFGEHWARHWMDLVRYAESHGSEGDPDTPEAWRYRDYLIRAFNNDVPYDQLIREHLAGDLLASPRRNPGLRINESILGTAHLRMVEHGFQPVDPWEDRVKWTDNQIDVFSKAFQGLTVSCARCHDHKFDAIAQTDFYALFSAIAGARPTQRAIDFPEDLNRNRQELARLKDRIREVMAADWLRQAENLPASIEQPHLTGLAWDLRKPSDFRQWRGHGTGLPAGPSQPGEFSIAPSGGRIIPAIYPAGVYSNLLSAKHNAVLTSPRFKIESDAIRIRLMGGNFSFAQLMIENYAVPRGGIYHLRHSPKRDQMDWISWDTSFWRGFTAYIELSTLDDVTHFILDEEDGQKKPRPAPVRDGRSWFGLQAVLFGKDSNHTVTTQVSPREAIEAWRSGTMTGEQASLLDSLVRNGALRQDGAEAGRLAEEYRRLDAEIPVARRAPSVLEECPPPQPLLVRGNLKNAGQPVPARYLAALGSEPYPDACSSRLKLAEEVASASNPLTARVLVNRVWSHLFGRGLVATVDNFGKLGEPPSHPELLDWLAARFVEEGWSMKKLIRMMVTSRAYRMSSEGHEQSDPSNIWLSRMPVRRLQAESIRDAMLAVSGGLDLTMYGQSVPVYYAHETGKTKGDKPKGPLDGNARRSVYLEIRRNATNPFLEVFDFPVPSTTRGQRDVTNVPAQSLALMNSQFVFEQAEKWAGRMKDSPDAVSSMFQRALGRNPSPEERDRALSYLNDAGLHGYAIALFNLKEFIYLR